MIQRRTLLKSTAAVALGAPALSSLAQQTVTLKFHTFMAPQSNVWLNMHKAWMDKVEKESGGRIKFEGYPAMQLGGTPVQLYDQAKDGVVDIIWTLPGNTAGRFPRVEVFELPFMMTNAEATSRAAWDFYQHSFNDLEVNERAKLAGRYAWCEAAMVGHEHWVFGQREQDATDTRLLGAHAESERIYAERAKAGFPTDYEAVITE